MTWSATPSRHLGSISNSAGAPTAWRTTKHPVIVGDEANRARVELLREWLASYRPAADIASDESGEDNSDEGAA